MIIKLKRTENCILNRNLYNIIHVFLLIECILALSVCVCARACVSQKSEYNPNILPFNLVYLFKGQYYRTETWIYFRVLNVQLVKH